MEGTKLAIHIGVIAVILCIAAAVVVTTFPKDPDTIYPLGDSDYDFNRDTGTGSVFTMDVVGKITYEAIEEGKVPEYGEKTVAGTYRVEVTDSDNEKFRCHAVLTLDGDDPTERDMEVDRATGEVTEIGGTNDTVDRTMLSNSNSFDTKDITDRWGPHKLVVTNHTYYYKGVEHKVVDFIGKDDSVYYKMEESYIMRLHLDGVEVDGTYELTYLLDHMDFKHR